jgi:phenylalanyl-tRNA synthetase beta chain
MKLSLEWLREYVALPPDLGPKQLAETLTMATVEVEQAIDLSSQFDDMVVGVVESLEPHPDADRLRVAQCRVGRSHLEQIVCGAVNVTPGMKVAVASPGAAVRRPGEQGPVVIQPTRIRGVESVGMMCAASEIGLEELFPPGRDRDIVDLSGLPCVAGDRLAEAIGFHDLVLEIDNKSLTNRPDLWGHYGIARELAVLYTLPLKELPRFTAPSDADGIVVRIEDPERCRRYTATRVAGVVVTEAPFWMRSRLARVGQRPINLLVDLTNYVLLALGQPSHAFDARLLHGALQIRQGRPDEEMELLDERRITLDERALVIADDEGPVALAGVMGGSRSAIADDTAEMILEVAHFEPSGVRRASARFDARTESSARFEKGLDPRLIDDALGLFFSLLRAAQPGARATGFVDDYPAPFPPVQVVVSFEMLERKLGERLPEPLICDILRRLGFGVEPVAGGVTLTVPSWRATGDVSIPEDIVEEVARIYGYEELETSVSRIELVKAATRPGLSLERRLREYLAHRGGMQEIAGYPWVEERYLAAASMENAAGLALKSPPSQNRRRLKPSLIPPMIGAVVSNLRHFDSFRVFELCRVFHDAGFSSLTEPTERLPSQPKRLAAALVGTNPEALFLELKGLIEAMGREVQIEPLSFSKNVSGADWADPNGRLGIHAGGQVIGHLGVLSGKARRLAGIRHAHVALFEVDVAGLTPLASRDNRFQALPEFPQVDYDLSVIFDVGVRWEDVERTVYAADELVRSVTLVEEYRGAQVPEGRKSLTLKLRLSSATDTLTAEQIEAVAAKIVGSLSREFGADVRGVVGE